MEEQIVRLRQQVEAAEAELIEREAELVDLRASIFSFQADYHLRVGHLVTQLQGVEAAIERCHERISDYRQWGPDGPPSTVWGTPYVSVEEQYRRTWQDPEPSPPPPPPPQQVGPEAEARIKTLYRKLCRRFHPDLTQDPVERAWRTDVMASINAAYAARSLTELRALDRHPGYPRPSGQRQRGAETGQRRLDALRDRLQTIQRRLRAAKGEIQERMRSQMMELSIEVKVARSRGRDLLTELAADVEKELGKKRAELDFLRAQLTQLGIALDP